MPGVRRRRRRRQVLHRLRRGAERLPKHAKLPGVRQRSPRRCQVLSRVRDRLEKRPRQLWPPDDGDERQTVWSGPAAPAGAPRARACPSTSKHLSPVMIWAGFGVAAMVVVLVIFIAAGSPGGASDASTTGGSRAAQPVSADTSGSYAERCSGPTASTTRVPKPSIRSSTRRGRTTLEAASKVYAAAWKLQSTDPNVGTDYATSLFYSGRIDAALTQVEKVLAKSPGFQTAWFNKGNYLSRRRGRRRRRAIVRRPRSTTRRPGPPTRRRSPSTLPPRSVRRRRSDSANSLIRADQGQSPNPVESRVFVAPFVALAAIGQPQMGSSRPGATWMRCTLRPKRIHRQPETGAGADLQVGGTDSSPVAPAISRMLCASPRRFSPPSPTAYGGRRDCICRG